MHFSSWGAFLHIHSILDKRSLKLKPSSITLRLSKDFYLIEILRKQHINL